MTAGTTSQTKHGSGNLHAVSGSQESNGIEREIAHSFSKEASHGPIDISLPSPSFLKTV